MFVVKPGVELANIPGWYGKELARVNAGDSVPCTPNAL